MIMENRAKTLGELLKGGYTSKSIKDELRDNLINALQNKKNPFEGIFGYDDTVIPDVQRAILSRHHFLLLGLRGQAKTKIARLLTNLLDEWIPYLEGSELFEDPLLPITSHSIRMVKEQKEDVAISWLHRSERYVEKLATPDVSVADLIGDIDPIKAAHLKKSFSDEEVIHYGLLPKSNRCIFVINEIPDLQARIQVALFNILQEQDVQIKGFRFKMPLDLQMVFTANPEDYTHRGSIITPLKDRIESQILTHYPKSIEWAQKITKSEAHITPKQKESIYIPSKAYLFIEEMVELARNSEWIDPKSGVSPRLSISALENLYSTAERRSLIHNESSTTLRITDFWGMIPSMTGKMELLYEGEQEGPYQVALHLISETLKKMFLASYPDPTQSKNKAKYKDILKWFNEGNQIQLLNDSTTEAYQNELKQVNGLPQVIAQLAPKESDIYFEMELVLHGLVAHQLISLSFLESVTIFKDPLADALNDLWN
jgi:magnesium chelatase subunit I